MMEEINSIKSPKDALNYFKEIDRIIHDKSNDELDDENIDNNKNISKLKQIRQIKRLINDVILLVDKYSLTNIEDLRTQYNNLIESRRNNNGKINFKSLEKNSN